MTASGSKKVQGVGSGKQMSSVKSRPLFSPDRGRWDVIICANDHTAATLMRTFQQISVRVPQDVRVVGFDDATFATLVSPALTTVLQPCREITTAAFRTMIDRQTDPALPARHTTISPRLVVQDSYGACLPRGAAGKVEGRR